MGSPGYETPYPVKRSDGSQIIWDWDKKDWLPYDPDAAKKNAPATPSPSEPPAGAAEGSPDKAPSGPAPDRYGGGDRNPGDRNSSPGPTVQQRRRRLAARVSSDFEPPGTTLLTSTDYR